jgi:hypothetical protein
LLLGAAAIVALVARKTGAVPAKTAIQATIMTLVGAGGLIALARAPRRSAP